MNVDRLSAPTSPIVFVVDDDAGILKSLAALMEVESIPARTYSSAESFLAEYDPRQPGCLVVDMQMPGMSGIDLIERLRSSGGEIPVIVMTAHGDIPSAVRSIQLGATEFLQKPVQPRLMLEKIRAAIGNDCARRAARSDIIAARQILKSLTNREQELVRLLVAGMPNKQIAAEMGISVKTVEHHRAHVMSKTGAANAADLVRIKMLADMP